MEEIGGPAHTRGHFGNDEGMGLGEGMEKQIQGRAGGGVQQGACSGYLL